MTPPLNNLTFLTGSTGLVGGHFLIYLHRSGKKVRALIRPHSNFVQLRLICSFYSISFEALHKEVDWVYGDTLDFVGLCNQMEGVEEVYHCAAVVSFNSKNRKEVLQTNIQGTANVVDAALKCSVKQFCFISSIGALGQSANGDLIKENTPWKNEGKPSAYSESKFRSELEVWRAQNEGLNAVIINPGVILGPGSPDKGSLLLFQAAKKGMPFYTKAVTGYVDVRDVCRVGIQLMENKIFGKRFLLVSENLNNKEIFSMIASEFKVKPPRYEANKSVLFIGALLAELYGILANKTPQLTWETARTAQKSQFYSNRLIREALNFEFIPLLQTIHETCKFLKETGN